MNRAEEMRMITNSSMGIMKTYYGVIEKCAKEGYSWCFFGFDKDESGNIKKKKVKYCLKMEGFEVQEFEAERRNIVEVRW